MADAEPAWCASCCCARGSSIAAVKSSFCHYGNSEGWQGTAMGLLPPPPCPYVSPELRQTSFQAGNIAHPPCCGLCWELGWIQHPVLHPQGWILSVWRHGGYGSRKRREICLGFELCGCHFCLPALRSWLSQGEQCSCS